MAKSANELAEVYGESFCKVDINHKEVTALWFLINLQYRLLVKDKGIKNTELVQRLSSAKRTFATCSTDFSTWKSRITFAPSNILNHIRTDPMEIMGAVFHITAHELAHALSYQQYGELGSGHGRHWQGIMQSVFGIEGARVYQPTHVWQVPQVSHKTARWWDMWDLYQTWRLEEVNWKDPLVEKIINGMYANH